jgi:hypothetical protein
MFHFNTRTHIKLIALAGIVGSFVACEESTTSPVEEKPKNKLLGKWAEVFPDTTTELGKQIFNDRTGVGTPFRTPWYADTMQFVSDSTVLLKPDLVGSTFTELRYKTKSDTLFLWSAGSKYDTSTHSFEIRNDTLFTDSVSTGAGLQYRTTYTRY